MFKEMLAIIMYMAIGFILLTMSFYVGFPV